MKAALKLETWAGLVFTLVIGAIHAGRMTLASTLLMEYTEDRYRGRVMGLLFLAFGLMSAGVPPMTTASEFIGAPIALGNLSAIFTLIMVIMFVATPHLRRLE